MPKRIYISIIKYLYRSRTSISNFKTVAWEASGKRIVAKVTFNGDWNGIMQSTFNMSSKESVHIGEPGFMLFDVRISFDKKVGERFDRDGRKLFLFECSAIPSDVPCDNIPHMISNFGNTWNSKGRDKGESFTYKATY